VNVLVTGATGSFGRAFITAALVGSWFKRIIAFSDTESNQAAMKRDLPPSARLEYFIGNVRDYDRLRWAFRANIDVVLHAAAMKEVPTCEYDWPEAVATNVEGSRNVALAAVECGVPKALLISTDKAAEAFTEYGKTKAMAESWFIRTNIRGGGRTHLSAVRYGNVRASRSSVIPIFERCRETGEPLPITDLRMTRFWWDMRQAVSFVRDVFDRMNGGEIWVPKIEAEALVSLGRRIAPENLVSVVGIRGKEKLHEVLITEDEARHTYELPDAYVIMPPDPTWPVTLPSGAVKVPEGFRYSSDLTVSPWEGQPCSVLPS
jgi:UDP-N-acetylglucosamine 4,6-dehydratase